MLVHPKLLDLSDVSDNDDLEIMDVNKKDKIVRFCSKCAKKFVSMTSWDRHERFCTPPFFSCPHCSKIFQKVGEAEKHFKEEQTAMKNDRNTRDTLRPSSASSRPPRRSQHCQTMGVRCEICRRVFVNSCFRDKHIKKDHPEEVAKEVSISENAPNLQDKPPTQQLPSSEKTKWIMDLFRGYGITFDSNTNEDSLGEMMAEHNVSRKPISRRSQMKLLNPPQKICSTETNQCQDATH